MKVHPVFHAKKLRLAPENPLPGQKNIEPPVLVINDYKEYKVQEVLAVRLRRKKLQYRVKWKGWDDDLEFYPASSLRNSPLALQAFHQKNPTKPGPLANLDY